MLKKFDCKEQNEHLLICERNIMYRVHKKNHCYFQIEVLKKMMASLQLSLVHNRQLLQNNALCANTRA